MSDLICDEQSVVDSDDMGDVYEMPREIIVDNETEHRRDYIEVGVEAGDYIADLYVEDAEGAVSLRLSPEELDALIDALQQAREAVALNVNG